MEFWSNSFVFTALTLVTLLAVAEFIRALIAPLRRFGLPASIIAGTLGLGLGPSGLDALPVDLSILRAGVYHALGIVFIALSLQAPAQGMGGGGKSMAFGITTMVCMQTVLGLAVVLILGLVLGSQVHPGFGLMLPLGFEQGPGQALAMGSAWAKSGMESGADVGLIVAAVGYAWAVFVGMPLVAWGKSRGYASSDRSAQVVKQATVSELVPEPGGLERLAAQVVTIGLVYLATFGFCTAFSTGLAKLGAADVGHMIWGFHFMIGALLAMAVRPLFSRLPGESPLDDVLLGRLAGLTVDVSTCAALAAVQLSVLAANWLPIALVTTVGGLATLVACVWFSVRAFPDSPFEHCVIWFGSATGTLPMGLALLRIIDPELRSPAPASVVLGSAGAVVGVAPILLLIHPIPIAGWGDGYPMGGWLGLGAAVVYLVVTVGLWAWFGGLKITGKSWVEWASR